MKKCYIAGKITGMEESEYRAKFESAKDQVINLGYEPVSPLELSHNHGQSWEEFMKEDIKAMLGCDAVLALDNWSISQGATIEVSLAKSLNMKVYFQGLNPVIDIKEIEGGFCKTSIKLGYANPLIKKAQ